MAQKELLAKLDQAIAGRDLTGGLERICAYAGARHYLVARCEIPADDHFQHVVSATWPFDLVRTLGAEILQEQSRLAELDRAMTTLQPVMLACPETISLPIGISRTYCAIPFIAGLSRMALFLLFPEGLVLSQERLQDAALLCAYHAGELCKARGGPERTLDLTEREIECLAWIAEGKTSDEISMIIGISRNTVNNYITSIMRKTATKTRSEAIAMAVRQQLI